MPGAGRWVVLVVEDDWLVRNFTVSHFESEGWAVLQCESAEEALCLMKTSVRVDVVLTDINLKGRLTGWDLADAVRARYPSLPIMYASGHPVDASRAVPDSRFFSKPYDPHKILQACEEVAQE